MEEDIHEAWRKLEKSVYKAARDFAKAHKAEFEEVKQTACLIFLKAAKKYAKKKKKPCSLHTYVRNRIRWDLQENARRIAKQASRHLEYTKNLKECLENRESHQESKLNLRILFLQLSDDARLVVSLVIDPPFEEENSHKRWRKIKEILSDMGWDDLRVVDSFFEIRGILP